MLRQAPSLASGHRKMYVLSNSMSNATMLGQAPSLASGRRKTYVYILSNSMSTATMLGQALSLASGRRKTAPSTDFAANRIARRQ